MNAERLHAIASALKDDLSTSSALSLLQSLVSSLSQQVSQPNQPQYQTQTAQYLQQLLDALDKAAVNDFSPTWRQALDEIGATPVTGRELAESVRLVFARNQITPSIAQDALQGLLTRLQELSTALDQLVTAYRALGVGSEELAPGECEVAVLVPRLYVDNRVDRFADELGELNQIFGVFAEIAASSRPGFEIKTISASDLSVYLEVASIVGACIATAVERVVALYKQLLEIRRLQADLAKQGLEKKNLKGVEDHANGVMELGIEKLAKELLSEYLGKIDAGRKNELSIELKFALKKIANRIDRGFNFEVRMIAPEIAAQRPEEATPDEVALLKAHETVRKASAGMQFLKLEGEPILQLEESKDAKPKG